MAKAILGIVLLLVSCYFVVLASGQLTYPPDADALNAIRRNLKDPEKNLRNWKRGDPCVANWTGVICTLDLDDGYRHVQELRMLNLNLTGKLAPELGQLSYMLVLNFMWNSISGTIPKEIGNLKALQFLLLSGNQLSGSLPDELGNLTNLIMLQADMNQISGALPRTFVNLTKCKHLHLNNNSISGQIPSELYPMPQVIHFLLDNNNLSGYLPPEFSMMPNLRILQLDNNDFGGTEIPASYGNISTLVKVSLRNCNLTGAIPDFSGIRSFRYLDLGHNQLTGGIPTNKLSDNVTTIDLSYNSLNGSIPSNFSGFPRLQRLSLNNNSLTGDVPSAFWQNQNFTAAATLIIDFRNNMLSNISGSINPPSNVTMRLDGNPICNSANQLNIAPFCGIENEDNDFVPGGSSNSNDTCQSQSCPLTDNYEYVPDVPDGRCFCAQPFKITLRLRSPTITDFRPYVIPYKMFMTHNLSLALYQLDTSKFIWEAVHRLRLNLTFYPQYSNDTYKFNYTEVYRIIDSIATFAIPTNDTFGPYEIIAFYLGPYTNVSIPSSKSGISKGAVAGIILGAISLVVVLSLVIIVLFYKRRTPSQHQAPKKQTTKVPIRTESVKEFSFEELEAATSSFSDTTQVGQGGYGKVYRGILANGTVVAIKRARQGSLQGQLEFITEIELLSRLHHRNLVSLVGYCGEKDEQMLVYEFMPNGSLHDLLSDRYRHTLSFPLRLRIALGAAKGILYLHTEADPPIIHRDIKANNILLDFKFNPKVSDFGISRLAPVPDDEGASAHVSTVVKGTPGYLDPEYFLTHKLTEKSDVYSLGIVFLELLTGMLPISHGRNIVREVCGACEAGLMLSIIDKSMGSYPSECIKKFMALALKCCQDDPKERPTMLEVVRALENLSAMVPESDHSNNMPTDSDATDSNPGLRVASNSSPLNYSHLSGGGGRNSQPTTEVFGSELVSGVIPTIRPR